MPNVRSHRYCQAHFDCADMSGISTSGAVRTGSDNLLVAVDARSRMSDVVGDAHGRRRREEGGHSQRTSQSCYESKSLYFVGVARGATALRRDHAALVQFYQGVSIRQSSSVECTVQQIVVFRSMDPVID